MQLSGVKTVGGRAKEETSEKITALDEGDIALLKSYVASICVWLILVGTRPICNRH